MMLKHQGSSPVFNCASMLLCIRQQTMCKEKETLQHKSEENVTLRCFFNVCFKMHLKKHKREAKKYFTVRLGNRKRKNQCY